MMMTFEPTFTTRRLKARAGVILFHEGKLLLMRQNNASFWVLPGGTLEENESLPQCALRELEEEAGLILGDPILIGLSEFSDERRHVLDATFTARYLSGSLAWQPPYPENINAIEWVEEQDFQRLTLKPNALQSFIQQHWQVLSNYQSTHIPGLGYLGFETP
jgi:8-oxo-dGTP pyrophosphatase MutT (NUDIX family)